MKYRWEVINSLIKKFNYKTYLEIGVRFQENFSRIEIEDKVSVDPMHNPTYKMTSDEFFKINKKTFDFIFLDGLHHSDQIEKDIINSLEVLNEGGKILCHDMNPKTKEGQEREMCKTGGWWGDVWKAWVKLKSKRKDLNMNVINADCGLGLIEKGEQEIILCPEELEWSYWKDNSLKYLISIEEFQKIYLA